MAKKDEIKTEKVSSSIEPKIEKTEKSENKEEMIQVSKSEFDRVLKMVETLSKDRDTLFKVADKGRLARIADQQGRDLIRQAKISKWPGNGLYIIGWKLAKNMSEIVPGTGRWVEDQSTTLVFEDHSTVEVPLIDFYRMPIKETADIVESQSGEKNGVSYTIITVEFPNGKRLSIDNKFIN